MNSHSSEVSTALDAGDCAAILRVLADHTRLAVVRLLMREPHQVGAIGTQLNVEQTLLSHHLRVLREAGIVEAERVGREVSYRLTPRVAARRRGRALDLGCCRLQFAESASS